MRHVNTIAVISGPLVLLGYLALATTRWAFDRRRLRTPGTAAVEAAVTLAVTTIAWHTVLAVAPGSTISRVALLSAQALAVWESLALWVGLAAVVGHMAPLWSRFDGGSGLPPAMAICLVYAPTVFSAAVGGFFIGLWALRTPRDALPVALGAAVTFSWLSWIFMWRPGWGISTGPELSLMTALIAVALFARWLRGDVLVPVPDAPAD